MKKRLAGLAFCAAAVLLASCGTLAEKTDSTATKQPEDVQETETVPDTEAVMGAAFTVELVEDAGSDCADDGTKLLTYSHTYPEVSGGNSSAAEAINQDIAAVKATYQSAAETILGYAKEDYALRMQEAATEAEGNSTEESWMPFPYTAEESATVTRNDAGAFSFVLYDMEYTGGAHGSYAYTGYSYDAATGERLTWDQLSADPKTFRQNILADIKAQCETDAYQELLFPEYADYLEETIFAENSWYLTESGMTVSCPPYALGSYAAGNIDFEISYETLLAYGLKSAYAAQTAPAQ